MLALIIALFGVGVILIGIELFVTPGFIVGLLGMAFIGVGVYSIYNHYGAIAGNVALVTVSAALLLLFVLGLRSGFWQKLASKEQITGKANQMHQINLKVGDTGQALSALRPSGMALFSDQRLEVQSDGEFIDSGAKVEVSKINENKIFVKSL